MNPERLIEISEMYFKDKSLVNKDERDIALEFVMDLGPSRRDKNYFTANIVEAAANAFCCVLDDIEFGDKDNHYLTLGPEWVACYRELIKKEMAAQLDSARKMVAAYLVDSDSVSPHEIEKAKKTIYTIYKQKGTKKISFLLGAIYAVMEANSSLVSDPSEDNYKRHCETAKKMLSKYGYAVRIQELEQEQAEENWSA